MPNHILVVDDEAPLLRALLVRLRIAGYEVDLASCGEDGLAQAAKVPDLILLDIRMPGIDGFEVNRRLKADPRTTSIPVIFLSANVQDSARQAAIAAGARAFLTKPYDPKILLDTVASAINLNREPAHAAL
jgi:CheY-like chemotaxis protein